MCEKGANQNTIGGLLRNAGSRPQHPYEARYINCDQVVWMLNAIGRYLPNKEHPAVSRAVEMQKYAMLYELMEVANLCFLDEAAQHNATPPDVHLLLHKSKQIEKGLNHE